VISCSIIITTDIISVIKLRCISFLFMQSRSENIRWLRGKVSSLNLRSTSLPSKLKGKEICSFFLSRRTKTWAKRVHLFLLGWHSKKSVRNEAEKWGCKSISLVLSSHLFRFLSWLFCWIRSHNQMSEMTERVVRYWSLERNWDEQEQE